MALAGILAFGVPFLLSLGLTALLRPLALRLGFVDDPGGRKVHPRPIPLGGGVAIALALASAFGLAWACGALPPSVVGGIVLRAPDLPWILAGALAVLAAGLWDDLKDLGPWSKLAVQILAALGVAIRVPEARITVLGAGSLLQIALTVVWIVAITNAFNFMDNMDGLAAGVAALSGVFFSFHALGQGSPGVAIAAAAFAGAHAGFLPFNFKPARIFMGDCGSMAAGFFLSAASMAGTWRGVSNLLFVVLIPLLILAVPIFNMVFIIITRKLSGVPVFHGKADHISYRLVAHGLSERKSVALIYALSAGCGMLALGFSRLGSLALIALISIVTLALLYFGVFLYEASVRNFYSDFRVEWRDSVDLTKLPFAQYWWRLFQVLGDVILISGGYFLAYLMRFEGSLPAAQERNFILTLPYLILVKTMVFGLFRLYGSHWRYVGVNDLLKILQAAGLSALALAAGVALIRPEFFSRSVIVIDAIVTVLLIGGSRVLLRVFREFILESRSGDTLVRTVIVGAGDSGELMLREARNNGKLGLDVVGFLDDDPSKAQGNIHGVRVLGATSALPHICRDRRVELAIVAMPSAPHTRVKEIAGLCREAGITCKILSIELLDCDTQGEIPASNKNGPVLW